jgi:hypothetical protein
MTLADLLHAVQGVTPYNLLRIGEAGITTAEFLATPHAEAMRRYSAQMYHSAAPTITGPAMLIALEGAVIDTACAAHLLSTHTPELSRARHLIANHYGQGVAFPPGTALHPDALQAQLVERLERSIGLVAGFVGVPERALWPAAVDRVVGALLKAGGAIGWPDEMLLTTIERVRAGSPLATRHTGVYVVGGRLHLKRAACCHIDRTGAPLCANCPQRPAAERLAGLRAKGNEA